MPRLEVACLETLSKADDALFDLAQNARNNAAQQGYFDAMREVRREHGTMERVFGEYADAGFHEFRQPDGIRRTEPHQRNDPSLTLLAQEELEEQLAAEQTASVLHRRFKQVLEPMMRSFAMLSNAQKFEASLTPLSPERLAMAFRVALAGFAATTEVKLVLFKLYERQLMLALETVYPEALRALVDSGFATGQAARAAMPVRQVDPDVFDGNSVPQREFAQPPVHDQSSAHASQAGSYPLYPQGEIVDNGMLSSLHELLQAWRKVHPDAPAASQAQAVSNIPTAPPLSTREMMSVLSLFQAQLPDGVRSALQSSDNSLAQQLKRELITGAAALGISSADAHLGPAEEDAVDVVGMMFEVFLDKRDMQPDTREMIARLLVPYIKVALLDRRLFMHKAHPARRLLNAIAEACEGNHGEGPHERELLQRVSSAVDRLVGEFNEDLAIFELLEHELRSFIEQYRKRAELAERRVAEAQRGKERLEESRLRAETVLAEKIQQGRKIAPLVQDDLRRYWVHHYSVVFLREGEDSVGVGDALRTLDQMLGLADVAAISGGLTPAAETLTLQPGLLTMLASSGVTGDSAIECARVMAEHLMHPTAPEPAVMPAAVLAAVPEPAPGTVIELRPAAQPVDEAVAAMRVVGGTATLDYEPADVERVRALTVGTWVEFVDDESRMQPAKLSWVSPISARMLFVNRRGARVQVASLEELAAMMKTGALRLRVADTAFDEAMHQVLGRLREGGGREAKG